MASNIPTVSPGDTISSSAWGNVVKSDMDAVYDNWPQRAEIWHRTSTIVTGTGPLVWTTNAAHDGAFYYYTTPADGDVFTNSVLLEPGTYTMYIYGVTSAISGIIDWDLGGSSIATGQDWYSGGSVYDVTKTVTSISITDIGRYVLQGTVNGQNGSSAGYRIQLTRIWFAQASDT
jgi:hypothetical protein